MPTPQPDDLDAAAGAGAAAEAEKPAKPKKVAEEEDQRLRWAFVRKVYAILALQFALTAAIAATACLVRAVPRFFVSGPRAAAWTVYIAILVSSLIAMWPMLKYREKHPVNLWLLGLFTLCYSLSIAVAASTTLDTVVLQATILTAAAVVGPTLFTFWAVKRGCDFTFMFPFLFTSLLVLLVYITIQIFFPLGRVGMIIYGSSRRWCSVASSSSTPTCCSSATPTTSTSSPPGRHQPLHGPALALRPVITRLTRLTP